MTRSKVAQGTPDRSVFPEIAIRSGEERNGPFVIILVGCSCKGDDTGNPLKSLTRCSVKDGISVVWSQLLFDPLPNSFRKDSESLRDRLDGKTVFDRTAQTVISRYTLSESLFAPKLVRHANRLEGNHADIVRCEATTMTRL